MRIAAFTAVVVIALAGPALSQPQPAASPAYVMPANTPANVRRAVDAPDRTAEMKARDFHRKPAEIMTMAGIKDGDQILEIASFGQYFTTMLSAAVGPKGKVYMWDLPYTEERSGAPSRAFVAAHANTEYHVEDYNTAKFPQNLDAVYIVLYYHDLKPANVDTVAFDKKVLAALKPGGTFLIIDHKAEDGSGWRDAATIHRMGVETIKQEVLSAGFELATESNLLANPQDDRTKMVFAPGTRGTTDQAFFIFRKPK